MTKKIFYLRGLILSSLMLAVFLPSTVSAVTFSRPLWNLLNPPVSSFYDNNGWGAGALDYKCGGDSYDRHAGTDFRATIGTMVFAGAHGGVVVANNNCSTWGYRGSNCGGGYGNYVRLDHEGDLYDFVGTNSIYAHLQQNTIRYSVGRYVTCQAFIARTGSSGSSTGPHLHFEVRNRGHFYDDPFKGMCNARGAGARGYWTYNIDYWNPSSGMPDFSCQGSRFS